jgi:ABC-type Fe3+/spermidine/putrescine transport system ATPase subunit
MVMEKNPCLEVKNLSFKYKEKNVLNQVTFELKQGEHLSLIGESGCGKSTLLKLIYGLFSTYTGEIIFENKPILGPEINLIPGEKNMKYLAQDFDLMKFHTVEENIGLFLSNQNQEERTQRIYRLLSMLEMSDYANVQTKNLSGGQQQRVALARVLAQEPKLLLLDEPFSQIDQFRKNTLRRNLFAYLKEKNIACIVATHDYLDVLSFSDRVLIMKNGELERLDTPEVIYNNPNSYYSARLFGETNEINPKYLNTEKSENQYIFPHQLKIVQHSNLKVEVTECYFKGQNYLIECIYEDGFIYFDSEQKFKLGQKLFLGLK